MKTYLLLAVLLATVGQIYAWSAAERGNLATGMNGRLSHIGGYFTGSVNEDGGIAEIVQYNRDAKRIYVVNGTLGSLDIVDVKNLRSGSFTSLNVYRRIDLRGMGTAHGFEYGDLTSVAVSTKNALVALAVQHRDYAAPGYIVLTDYEGDYVRHYSAGVQPDMICFTGDERYVLTADEGEPREGYSGGAVDPSGSVTILDISRNEVRIVGFGSFDAPEERAALIQRGVILNAGAKPSVDLEPEYIATSNDSRTAWVSLQEANALAVLDIPRGTFTSVTGLGFKNHYLPTNTIDAFKDGKAELASQDLFGVYMPDGIATVTIGGPEYVITANEGDAREWGAGDHEYADITSLNIGDSKIDVLDNAKKDGLDENKTLILGARSFSIWEVRGKDLRQVFDSGNDFETITAAQYPDTFNASHTNNDLDSRSGKKGPEPEYVSVLRIGQKTYALIGLERIGGVMMYDISDPSAPVFYDYLNTRDFSKSSLAEMGDLGPEGICAVAAEDSPTGRPLIFTANEVSGTIAVFEVK
ncbi:MAG: choice-of-anchor I family protein [Spirochaetaceae bacterium]|jgi:hypothetical protein|nr:choice-of-anchor I family protein [Spirochaetaceae bacterium]